MNTVTDRNPSGLPKERINTSMWGPGVPELEYGAGVDRSGVLRVRRTLLVVVCIVAGIAAVAALAGSGSAAAGLAALLVPLLFVLGLLHLVVRE